MSFNTLLGYLVVAASTTLGSFIVLVGVDIIAGIVLALRKGTFDANKLPLWLGEQFATREFLGVVSLGATAGLTALGSTIVHGGLTEVALQTVAQIALAAMTAGAAAMMASVLSDVFGKVQQLLGAPTPVLPPVPPTPVTVVPPAPPVPVPAQSTPTVPPSAAALPPGGSA